MRKLKRLRAEKGLTMDALEERTGVSKRTISEIERGMRAPQALTLAKLAGALGVGIDELLEEEAPKAPSRPSPEAPELQADEERRALSELPELQATREKYGMGLDELAFRSGVPRSEIEAIEDGRRLADRETVGQLRKALGCSKAELIFPRELAEAWKANLAREALDAAVETLSEKEIRELRMASPVFRKLAQAINESAERHAREQPEAG